LIEVHLPVDRLAEFNKNSMYILPRWAQTKKITMTYKQLTILNIFLMLIDMHLGQIKQT